MPQSRMTLKRYIGSFLPIYDKIHWSSRVIAKEDILVSETAVIQLNNPFSTIIRKKLPPKKVLK